MTVKIRSALEVDGILTQGGRDLAAELAAHQRNGLVRLVLQRFDSAD